MQSSDDVYSVYDATGVRVQYNAPPSPLTLLRHESSLGQN